MRSFAISTDRIGPKRWWWVRIHPTVEELRQAARRYRPTSQAWVEAWGICQPTKYRVDSTGECHYPPNGFAGVIRLTDELLIPEIVAHELVHATAATYRMNVSRIADLVGDYLLQSDWMANRKVKPKPGDSYGHAESWAAAIAHGLTYTLPFLFVTRSIPALLVIAGTHIVIDHWRLARHVGWLKNFLAPRSFWYPWSECKGTGYHESRPPWMAVWLMIIADNTLHLLINVGAVTWL